MTMRIGIIGAGQLARMLALAGIPLGLQFKMYDPERDATGGQVAPLVVGRFDDIEALSQFAHFVSHHRKAFTGTARRRCLYGCVQRKHIRLLGNAVDQFYDITDFLGRFAQTLNTFGGLLNLLAYGIHAIDGFTDFFTTRVSDIYRFTGHITGLS